MECRFAMATGANKLRSSILLPSGVGNIIYGEVRLTEGDTTPLPPIRPSHTPGQEGLYSTFILLLLLPR